MVSLPLLARKDTSKKDVPLAPMEVYTTYVNVVTVFYILDRANRRIKKYPNFADRVHEALTDIFGESGKKIVTHHAEDGSGVGSAIIAGASLQYSRVKAKLISHLLFFSNDQGQEGLWILCRILISSSVFLCMSVGVYQAQF